jgi:hypothetical protein
MITREADEIGKITNIREDQNVVATMTRTMGIIALMIVMTVMGETSPRPLDMTGDHLVTRRIILMIDNETETTTETTDDRHVTDDKTVI